MKKILYSEDDFKPGDKVIDLTAVKNNWPDQRGEVIQVDGSNVKICYEGSGNKQWKKYINLRKDTNNTKNN